MAFNLKKSWRSGVLEQGSSGKTPMSSFCNNPILHHSSNSTLETLENLLQPANLLICWFLKIAIIRGKHSPNCRIVHIYP